MTTLTNRIKEIAKYKGLSERKLCKEIGVANGFLSKVNDVGAAKLNKILSTYTEICPTWLLTGDGEMVKNSDILNKKIDNEPLENILLTLIEKKDTQLQFLHHENGRLNAQINFLNDKIYGQVSNSTTYPTYYDNGHLDGRKISDLPIAEYSTANNEDEL